MEYKVHFSQEVRDEIVKIAEWYERQTPKAAKKWIDTFYKAVLTLENMPSRCGIAPDINLTEPPVRQLLFGKKHGQYRILFEIHGQDVHVLRVRHIAREPFHL